MPRRPARPPEAQPAPAREGLAGCRGARPPEAQPALAREGSIAAR